MRSVLSSPDRPTTDFVAVFTEHARRHPDSPVVRQALGRGRYAVVTFRQLVDRADACAGALSAAGVGPGTRVCLLVPPGPQLGPLLLALARIGAVLVVVDPGMSPRQLADCLAEAAPEVFIGIPLAHAARTLLRWGRGSVRLPITVGRRYFWGGPTLDGLIAGSPPAVVPRAPVLDAVAAVAFTSGSTGPAKPVEFLGRHLAAQVELIAGVVDLAPGERWLSTFPPFALAGPLLGLELVVPDVDPVRSAMAPPGPLAAEIERSGVAGMFAAPATLDRLSRHCVDRGLVLGTLRLVLSAGASLTPRAVRRLRRCLAPDALLYSVYGATECLPVSAIESRELLDGPARAAERGEGTCVGRPLPGNTVRVIRVDDGPIDAWSDDLPAPPGGIGEITVTGPSTSERYPGRERHTALAKIRDGDRVVHRTGDLGRFDEDGRLWFLGRKSQRVRTPRGDLCTEQVEPVADTVPGVRRSALVGVGEPGRQVPVLCVEAERGADRRRITAEVLALLAPAGVRHVLFHRRFPVDARHRSKIVRERLARWAARRLPAPTPRETS